ncbi:penicillin acylase family protein, partial [Escherichia coli]
MRHLLAAFVLLCIKPQVQAEKITTDGITKPVEILRDRWGVPHIYAQNPDDLFFAQGY